MNTSPLCRAGPRKARPEASSNAPGPMSFGWLTPELAKVDIDNFGIHLIDIQQNNFSAGNSVEKFSIQSISKVFTLTIALGKLGDNVWTRVGREPSGDPFNSIVQLEVGSLAVVLNRF